MAKKNGKILIVDDNQELLLALKFMLNKHFEEVRTEKSPNCLPTIIEKEEFDIYLLDMNFSAGINSGNEGIYWMNKILKSKPNATIVFITAYGDIQLAVKSMKEGATDFIQKSWDEKRILSTILSAFEVGKTKQKAIKLKTKAEQKKNGNLPFIYTSPIMKSLVRDIEKVAQTDASILILGENGTGKEVVAQMIHQKSNRAKNDFVGVDLGSITETLFESELFGHKKGSFTDAKEDRIGRFEMADNGTLFLDEIGNLDHAQQAKLLTVLQKKEIIKVGDNEAKAIDIRLISATNKPIKERSIEGAFREDLLFRINTIELKIPPLRERREDIPLLAEYYLKDFAEKYQKYNLTISMAAKYHLMDHTWPGNVRELKHSLEKAVIFAESNMLKPEDFSFDGAMSKNIQSETLNLIDNEKRIIKKAIDKNKNNLSAAAKELGINRSTLYAKIQKYEL